MAPQPKPLQAGAKRAQRPGKRKIGGDLQGEPIFRLSGPAAALPVPVRRPRVRLLQARREPSVTFARAQTRAGSECLHHRRSQDRDATVHGRIGLLSAGTTVGNPDSRHRMRNGTRTGRTASSSTGPDAEIAQTGSQRVSPRHFGLNRDILGLRSGPRHDDCPTPGGC